MTKRTLLNLALAVALSFGASCITSTAPTAAQLDAFERQLRTEARAEYAALDQQRAAGQLTQAEHAAARARLDQRIQNQVDTLAWSRHALAQSELKALGIPTPDKPVANPPPGVGQTQGSLYNALRTSGMGSQSGASVFSR